MYKFYCLEDITQEDLNKLALERNILAKENQQLKKQKEDVIEYIKKKKEKLHHSFDEPDWDYLFICNPDDLLRMLGEINE